MRCARTGARVEGLDLIEFQFRPFDDAGELVVAPGFIDIHNHSDNSIVTDGNAQSFIRQGVTSMIFAKADRRPPASVIAISILISPERGIRWRHVSP